VTVQEAQNIAPNAEKVVVKQSLGRFAAAHFHPSVACESLRKGAYRAVSNIKHMHPPVFKRPVSLEVTFLVADMAEMARWVRGVERVGPRMIVISSESLLDLYRMFVTVIALTRSLIDRS
jgi:D-amino peptidase